MSNVRERDGDTIWPWSKVSASDSDHSRGKGDRGRAQVVSASQQSASIQERMCEGITTVNKVLRPREEDGSREYERKYERGRRCAEGCDASRNRPATHEWQR